MLAIQVMQQIQRDARMREAADQIRDEVARLAKDVGLLGDRVRKLQTHFNQANEDIRQSIISVEKIEAHGERIQQVELGAQSPVDPAVANGNSPAGNVRRLGSRGVIFSGRFGFFVYARFLYDRSEVCALSQTG